MTYNYDRSKVATQLKFRRTPVGYESTDGRFTILRPSSHRLNPHGVKDPWTIYDRQDNTKRDTHGGLKGCKAACQEKVDKGSAVDWKWQKQ